MADPPRSGNILVRFLRDLRDFVQLLVDLVEDDELARASFGFSLDVGVVSELTAIVADLDAAARGEGRLDEVAAAAARLVEVSETVQLLVQAVEADLPPGVAVQEALGTLLDTVAMAYFAARYPSLLYLARFLGLLAEDLPQEEAGKALGDLLADTWASRTGPLETEDDARRLAVLFGVLGLAIAFTPLIVEKVFHRRVDPRSAEVLFGWEADPTSTTPVADRISERLVTFLGRISGEKLDDEGHPVADGELELAVTLALVPREHGGPGLWISLGVGGEADLHLGSGWHLVAEGDLADAIDVFVPGSTSQESGFLRVGAAAGGSIELRLERRDEGTPAGAPAEPWRLGEILEVKAAQLALRLRDREPMLEAALRLRDAALVVPRPEKGFFRNLIPAGGLRVDFDLGVVADSSPDLRLEGGSGLEATIPVRTSTPRLQGVHVYLALRTRREGQAEGPDATFEASAGFATKLGSFTATLDRFGVILPEAPHGLAAMPWLKLPNAIGVGIDGDVVKGGGFILFDPDEGRYAGVLALTIGRWSVTAFGLLTDLDVGYSLLIVLSVEFDPFFKGPFGIELVGLGGLLGHNHGANVPALQAAMRTGAVRTILFPADPVVSAPRVLTTLATVFPVSPGSSLLGLGFKLTWSGGLVSLVAAVIDESGPTPRVVVLASVEVVAPTRELPLLRLRMDAVGIIDSRRPSVEADGSMVESFIGPFAVTGDATFRFRGGDDGLFLLAAGGFHPSYTPPANANLPPQRRLMLSFPSDNPRLRLELYVALTSNSIQLGARLEISARKGGFSAEALLAFDALVERRPFHLTVDIEGRAAIRYEGSTLASVGLDLHVDGPSPWHVKGRAKLSLLFFSVTIPVEYTSGGDSSEEELPTGDAAGALTAALSDPASWETTAPTGAAALVALRTALPAGELAAHPAGRLGVRQGALPLGVEVTHLGRARVTPDRFDVDTVTVNGGTGLELTDVRAPFAAGEFVDLSHDERLSRPAFERFVAGFSAGGDGTVAGPAVAADLTYEEIVIGPDGPVEERPPRRPGLAGVLVHAAALGAAGSSPLRRGDAADAARRSPLVTLSAATRAVVDAATLRPVAFPAARPEATETELRQALSGALPGLLLVQAHEPVEA